jgi:hypothetical protein
MSVRSFSIGKTASYATDWGYLQTPRNFNTSTTKVILHFHGRGQTAYGAATVQAIRPHVDALLAAGFAIYSIDHARINSWGDPDAMRAIQDAKTYLTGLGIPLANIVGILGLSMGGQTGLNEIKRFPTQYKAAWLFNPVTDLRYFHDTSGQYTPSYSIAGMTNQGVWASEIETTYAPSTTASGAQTINGSGGPDTTLNLAAGGGKGFADGHNNAVTGKPTARANSANFTYSGKTDNTLTGCRNINATPIIVSNGGTVTGESPLPYATQSRGYSIRGEEAQWAGLTTKIKICQASDDTTVPPASNANDANGFVGRVNSSNVTLRSPAPTGDHVASLLNVPSSEVVDFFIANT